MVLISMLTGATDPKQKGSKAQRRQNFKKSFSATKALIVFSYWIYFLL
jgi:mRNA degradation ribonuclease J1/J2